MDRIGIIGAGAWGTALATVARRAGRKVILQAREVEVVAAVNESHENTFFLPGVELDPGIRATESLVEAADADAVLFVTPAQHLRAALEAVAGAWKPGVPAVICAKGIERGTLALMSEVAAEALPAATACILSGPTFAAEVARGLPTGVILATADNEIGEKLSQAICTPTFRAYRSNDLIGAEIGGAVKNVLAVACGIAEGRKFGDNARAALITRCLAEILRLGTAKGGKMETLIGLAGIGDLTLTCNAMQSRNFSLGVALGSGTPLTDILAERSSIAEGVFTASSVVELSARLGVDMPICAATDAILNHGADISNTIHELLARRVTTEF